MTNWKTFDAWVDYGLLDPFELDGVRLVMLSRAYPEAYDAFLDGKPIGYLKTRYGRFFAKYPDVWGEKVYSTEDLGESWGFFSPEERQHHLPAAVKALIKKHERVAAEEMGQRFIKAWHDSQRKEK